MISRYLLNGCKMITSAKITTPSKKSAQTRFIWTKVTVKT